DLRRNPARDPAVPYIQDLVVRGPYLRLVVPYVPGAGERAIRRRCTLPGEAAPLQVLDCLATLHAVSLDGKAIAGLRYDTGTDPRTERPVLVAMVDLRDIPPGRHELRVARVDAGDDEDPEWRVPFWRWSSATTRRCADARSWWPGAASARWCARPATRRAGSAFVRRCRRCARNGCARRRCSCRRTSPATRRCRATCTRSSPATLMRSSRCRSMKPIWT